MENASSGDYQGAIGAALGATDMAQAETWLRQALALYPSDPQILALAARFEQARGNNQRAADFWRAALAAMPPGSAVQSLDTGLVYPPGGYHAPAPGDLKRLLDPRNDPPARTTKEPPLPSYPGTYTAPAAVPPANQWIDAPSANPLPLPTGHGHTAPAQRNQPAPLLRQPHQPPIYVPQSMMQSPLTASRSFPAERHAGSGHPAGYKRTPNGNPLCTPRPELHRTLPHYSPAR